MLRTKRSKQYWHFDLGGSSTVEEETALVDDVEKVTCRWCGADDSVELVARADDV